MPQRLYDNVNGVDAYLYTIKEGKIEVDICDFGARINALRVGGVDVVLGFNSVKDYENSSCFAGATIGRVSNRIAKSKFTLNGKTYFLYKNEGENTLHGGISGFDKKKFSLLECGENFLTLQYVSKDGEENYPAELVLNVKYTVSDGGLLIEYSAISDGDTLFAPTNHAYFNLDGESEGDCRENILKLNAKFYTPTNFELIPTGEKASVEGTAFDFNSPKPIGRDFGKPELKNTNGYDHNYVLSSEIAAIVESEKTGIKMTLSTDLPCIQLYSGGMLGSCAGKTRDYSAWSGFCLEPQFCPNAINMDGFEKPVLKKGEPKRHYIKLAFEQRRS